MSTTALIAVAETARDIAAGLNHFLDAVPECATEITGLISECFAISSALYELSTAIGDYRYNRQFELIVDDVRSVRLSLDYTFEDVEKHFGRLGRSTYREVWIDIGRHIRAESGNTLLIRLEHYRNFLLGLGRIIVQETLDHREYENLKYKIGALLEVQQAGIIDNVNNLSVDDPGIQKRPSYERPRPRPPPRAPSPISPLRDRMRGGYAPQSPTSPTYEPDYFDYVPAAPEVPISPTTTTTFSSHSSSTGSSINHWVPRLFSQTRSTTPFDIPGQVSTCVGKDAPDASFRLAEEHIKLLELPFEEGDFVVRLYLRQRDQRAVFYCRSLRSNRSRKQSCLALTSLSVKRDASNLTFICVDQAGKLDGRWATLRFPTYERLVLFFGTFLALRSHDNGRHRIRHVLDDNLKGEKQIFAGIIIDDGFEHSLRLFKDLDSGGLRLQASVMGGKLNKAPVWIAFITHQVFSRTWMRKADSRTIYLTELQRYIFTTEYSPQLGPGGEQELHFDESDGAKGFMTAIDKIRRQ